MAESSVSNKNQKNLSLSYQDKRDLAEAITQSLDARRKVDEETHQKHHAFIDKLIEREEEKIERWKAIKRDVMRWGVLAFLGALLTALWQYFKSEVHK